MINNNITGATLSPCFTPTYKGMDVSIFTIINLMLLSVYILLIAENNLGGGSRISLISPPLVYGWRCQNISQDHQTLQMWVSCDCTAGATLF